MLSHCKSHKNFQLITIITVDVVSEITADVAVLNHFYFKVVLCVLLLVNLSQNISFTKDRPRCHHIAAQGNGVTSYSSKGLLHLLHVNVLLIETPYIRCYSSLSYKAAASLSLS